MNKNSRCRWMDENVIEQCFAWHGVYAKEIVLLGLTQKYKTPYLVWFDQTSTIYLSSLNHKSTPH